MVRRTKPSRQWTGLYYAREARGVSRSKLVDLSGVSKQQLSRLENGQIRLRLDHLRPFAAHLGYTPEQILLWGRFPGTGGHVESKGALREQEERHADPVKSSDGWVFPASFVRDQLHTSAAKLLVLDVTGDSMAPTVMSGDRVVVDTAHKSPSPDGLYAIRDTFDDIVVKRLQLLRSTKIARVKIISDNPIHAAEEALLDELKIVGKVVCCLKLF